MKIESEKKTMFKKKVSILKYDDESSDESFEKKINDKDNDDNIFENNNTNNFKNKKLATDEINLLNGDELIIEKLKKESKKKELV